MIYFILKGAEKKLKVILKNSNDNEQKQQLEKLNQQIKKINKKQIQEIEDGIKQLDIEEHKKLHIEQRNKTTKNKN